MGLSRSEFDACLSGSLQQALGDHGLHIDYSVDFGAEAAARSTKSLGFLSPLFCRAPAAWAWARMTVASIAIHSMSESFDTASKIRSNTPCSIQR